METSYTIWEDLFNRLLLTVSVCLTSSITYQKYDPIDKMSNTTEQQVGNEQLNLSRSLVGLRVAWYKHIYS
jgi:hypothetical protein